MSNLAELNELMGELERFMSDGFQAGVRFVGNELVKRTPKRTGFAAGWMPGLNAAPFTPGQPQKPRYPLPGDYEWDQAMQSFKLGDTVVLMSPADYIVAIALEGKSRQAPEPILEPAFAAAMAQLEAWRWEG